MKKRIILITIIGLFLLMLPNIAVTEEILQNPSDIVLSEDGILEFTINEKADFYEVTIFFDEPFGEFGYNEQINIYNTEAVNGKILKQLNIQKIYDQYNFEGYEVEFRVFFRTYSNNEEYIKSISEEIGLIGLYSWSKDNYKWLHMGVVIDDAISATCTETGLTEGQHCSTCGEILVTQEVVPALGHDLIHQEAQAATCTAIGWDAYDTCSRCDYTTYVEKAALGHDLVHHEAQTPTCTSVGWDEYDTCSRCDYTTYEEISALGHEEVIDAAVPATCIEDGKTEGKHCDRCSEILIVQEVIPLLGHDWDTPSYIWERGKNDVYLVIGRCVCKRDGVYSQTTVMASSEITTPATCTEMGITTYTAEFGGNIFSTQTKSEADIPALGHDLVHHEAQAPTCTAIGWDEYDTCSRCDYTTYVEKPALGHTETTLPAIEPTLFQSGLTEGKQCSVCETIIIPQEIIPATLTSSTLIKFDEVDSVTYIDGHAVEQNDEIPSYQIIRGPSCTERGMVSYTCSETETAHSHMLVIAPLGHDLEHHEAQEPTCTDIGWNEYDICTRCDYTTYTEIPALGHEWSSDPSYEWYSRGNDYYLHAVNQCTRCTSSVETTTKATSEITKPATCTAMGETTYTVEFTGEQFTTQVKTVANIQMTEHTLVAHEAIESTCTTAGNIAYWECSKCGKLFADEEAMTEIEMPEEIPAKGHTEVIDAAVPATCTEAGKTEGKHCDRCNEVLISQEVVPALGHDLVHHEAKAPTCTSVGWDEYNTCSRCDYTTYTEKAALGHDLVHHDVQAPTCTTIGWDEYDTCSRCDYTTYAEIPAIGHTETILPAVEPTLFQPGLTEGKQCSVCETIIVPQEIIPATLTSSTQIKLDEVDLVTYIDEHQIIQPGTVMKEPGCTSTGMATFQCAEPDHFNGLHILVLAKLDHELTSHEATAATCIAEGNTEYWYCSMCDKYFSDAEAAHEISQDDTVIAKAKHNYTPWKKMEEYGAAMVFARTCLYCGTSEHKVTSLNNMQVLYLPANLISIEEEAFTGLSCEAIIIPDGCTSIGEYAFAGCTNLLYVKIPASVTNYPASAFEGCNESLVIDWEEH